VVETWWAAQPIEVKAAVIGAIAAAIASICIGIAVWLLFGIPKAVEWHYKRVLMDLSDAKSTLENEVKTKSPGSTAVYVNDANIIAKSRHWNWVVRRARRWEAIKKRFS
jgi:hypothetical protein